MICLLTDVFLLVERLLVELGDVAIVQMRHVTLFLANLVVIAVQRGRLGLGDFPRLHFPVNALVLICQPIIHLIAPGMVQVPVTIGDGDARRPAVNHQRGDRVQGDSGFGHNNSLTLRSTWAHCSGNLRTYGVNNVAIHTALTRITRM